MGRRETGRANAILIHQRQPDDGESDQYGR